MPSLRRIVLFFIVLQVWPNAPGALAGSVSNGPLRIEYPDVGKTGPIRIYNKGVLVIADNWYSIATEKTMAANAPILSQGVVTQAVAAPLERVGVRLRIIRRIETAVEPDLGSFDMMYELRGADGVIRHSASLTPFRSLKMISFSFLLKASDVSPDKDQFRYIGENEQPTVAPWPATRTSGVISAPTRRPVLALTNKSGGDYMMLASQPAGVKSLVFDLGSKCFDLTRVGETLTQDHPLQAQALIGFGDNMATAARQQKSFTQEAKNWAIRSVETQPPTPALGQAPPAAKWSAGIQSTPDRWNVSGGDFRIGIDKKSGALRSWETDGGQWLDSPGGLNHLVWPGQKRVGPEGDLSNPKETDNGLDFDWVSGGLGVHHHIEPHKGYIVWEARIPNQSSENLLVETRLSLPARLGKDSWYYWDGLSLRRMAADSPPAETTTLVPGRRLSQGIFPAVCLHNTKVGMVAGLLPSDTESFYGSRAKPSGGPLETFYYVVRVAIPPHKERSVKFLLYASDPNWSWRSVADRYWSFWPELFDAPRRDDVWGFYGLAQPTEINTAGDKFIDLCRRMRVGAMEMPMPFAKGGDFYAPGEPAYSRRFGILNRDQLRQVFQISNIACCTLSYLIPMRCERQMAFDKYADSIIHRNTGAPYLDDSWELMPKGIEKLAAMFAWGDSFGDHVRQDLRRIVADYKPDGIYTDLGAYLIEDYGRMTEWSAFTDQGLVYTNAGIAYAKLLEDVASFAPQVQRNPGELIQYFEGFQGNAHLSNHTNDQPFYLRTHRLIMGRKPIYTGLTSIMTQSLLLDSLELGGLPVLAFHFHREWEATAREWADVSVSLARAGWNPINGVVTNDASVRVERFGSGAETLFTVRNMGLEPARVDLRFAGRFPGLSEFRNRVSLKPRVNEATGQTALTLTVPADELIVLRAEPAHNPPRRTWPQIRFLAEAEPTSVLAPDTTDTQHVAHCVKGFIELQAELLSRKTEVEIVSDAAKARRPNRVVLRSAPEASLVADGLHTLVLSGPDETAMRRLLGEYLETIELPLTQEKAKWTLAAPTP